MSEKWPQQYILLAFHMLHEHAHPGRHIRAFFS